MKIFIMRDEWWPVYSLESPPPTWALKGHYWETDVFDMDESEYEGLRKRYDLAYAAFQAVQDEIKGMYEKREKEDQ